MHKQLLFQLLKDSYPLVLGIVATPDKPIYFFYTSFLTISIIANTSDSSKTYPNYVKTIVSHASTVSLIPTTIFIQSG